ncbi:MAG: hypothetical protein KBT05_04500 [Bacteroidales bacterium]|nr:hypothetical protein [Candidatus Cryptobacteroides caccocaballi]
MSYPEHFHSIFARNCEVRHIDKPTASAFLSSNHLYGDAACRYRYGIFVRRYSGAEMRQADAVHPYPIGTLVAVAEFSSARNWQKGEALIRSYEWVRYASLPEVRVIGGMGKVLQEFIDEVNPDDIMSYAPAEHYDGEVYQTLGFSKVGVKQFGDSSSIKYRLKLTPYEE